MTPSTFRPFALFGLLGLVSLILTTAGCDGCGADTPEAPDTGAIDHHIEELRERVEGAMTDVRQGIQVGGESSDAGNVAPDANPSRSN